MDYDKSARAMDPDFVQYRVFLEVRKNLKIVDTINIDYHFCT